MTDRSTSRRRRLAGRTAAVTGAVALAAVAAVAAAIGFGGGRTGTPTGVDLPPATATVTRQSMVDTDDVPGDLGYGSTTTLAGRIQGVITKVPLPGDVIGRGQPVYRVDNTPIVLMYGEVAAYRTLGPGVTGVDVRQLGANLTALGFPAPAGDTFTSATERAVKQWQQSLGLPQTGQVDLGRVLFAPGDIRIDSVTTGVNESTGDGQEVLHYTGTSRVVTVQLQVSQQRLAREGTQVRIQMPDGATVSGTVQRVYTVIAQPADSRSDPLTLIEALISLADPVAAAGIEAAVVTVVFTAGEHKDVLTVPVAALVALAEGGYGLEVVEGSTTHYIRVSTGLFASGRVEVTGEGLTEGMTVGMPG
jgi:multidrug efflux system membrane fusion protein